MSQDTYRLVVTVRKRTDLDVPSSLDDAVSMVGNLLAQGSFLDVLAVEADAPTNDVIRLG